MGFKRLKTKEPKRSDSVTPILCPESSLSDRNAGNTQPLGENPVEHLRGLNTGEAGVQALEFHGHTIVIEPKLMQHGGV